MRLAVLASGEGTILEALIAAGLRITVVIVDRPCRAIEVAGRAGIPVAVLPRASFGPDFDRAAYSKEVAQALHDHRCDLAAIAGFGTVLDPVFFDEFAHPVLNTHPSLLPAFKGWHAVDDALAAGVKVTGCTVHLARLEVDEGPILAQEAVPVLPDDTVETLHERIKEVERRIYPEVLKKLMT